MKQQLSLGPMVSFAAWEPTLAFPSNGNDRYRNEESQGVDRQKHFSDRIHLWVPPSRKSPSPSGYPPDCQSTDSER